MQNFSDRALASAIRLAPGAIKAEAIGELGFDLVPQAPDSKVSVFACYVMQQNNAAWPDFRRPLAEIVTDCFVYMKAIDV